MAFASDTIWDDYPRANAGFPSIRTSWLLSGVAVLGLGVALAGWSLATVAAVHKMETSLSSTPTLLPESAFAPGAIALFDPAHRIEHLGDKRFMILVDVPGVDPSTIEVSMDKSILTIKGERKVDSEETGGKLTRQERVYGTFHRRFSLPESADAENISAHGRFGVLEIAIPKKPETTPRRIAINTGN